MLSRDQFILLSGARRHPEAEAIERLATEDAERLGLLDATNRRRVQAFNTLVGYVYPAATIERARVCALWCNWLFFFDDAHDEGAPGSHQLAAIQEGAERAVKLLRDGGPTATPLDALMLEFRERSRASMGDGWLSRFVGHVKNYLLHGTLPACRHFLSNVTPRLHAYELQREYDSAVYTALALIELAYGTKLSDEVLGDPDFAGLNRACTRTVAFFNDIASYPKEVLTQRNPNNLVHVLSAELRMTNDEALHEAVQMVNTDAREIERLERRLWMRYPGDEHVASYLVGIRHWQRGNIESSLIEPRYRAAASPFAELRV
ncbi:MAG: terpene synthase family protein [Archangium sp.]